MNDICRGIRPGTKVRFDPFFEIKLQGSFIRDKFQTGVVTAVYPEHRWFSVQYSHGLRTSFHFCEVGVCVFIID